jgi:hypothetical protein
VRARELDETERTALMGVLERIERAGKAVATELGADVRIELDNRGKFPFVGFRLQGLAKDARGTQPAQLTSTARALSRQYGFSLPTGLRPRVRARVCGGKSACVPAGQPER